MIQLILSVREALRFLGRLLLMPFMIVYLLWWDFRCRWLGWHKYYRVARIEWFYSSRRLYEYDVCRNFDCRAINLKTQKWTTLVYRDGEWKPEGEGNA